MSTLRTNDLEGVDAKNSITIVAGAGNITTTNVQEGLAKCWVNFDGTANGAASRDSLNVSAMTDNGTGDYTISISNDMNNDDYCTVVSGAETGSSGDTNQIGSLKRNGAYTTTSVTVCGTHTNSQDDVDNQRMMAAIHGDLA